MSHAEQGQNPLIGGAGRQLVQQRIREDGYGDSVPPRAAEKRFQRGLNGRCLTQDQLDHAARLVERLLHGAEERLKKFRYFTFESSIDLDEAILVDYIARAAELAVMPSGARRALAEAHAEPVPATSDDVPADWELVPD